MTTDPRQAFLNFSTFAVAGASRNRDKYGNIVLLALRTSGRSVYAINPAASQIEGESAYQNIASIPVPIDAISIVTPPDVSRTIVRDAMQAGVKAIWFQPGAEAFDVSRLAREAGLVVIDDGSCILVALAQLRGSQS